MYCYYNRPMSHWPKNKKVILRSAVVLVVRVWCCFSVFNTLPTECFLTSTGIIQRGKSEHPRDSLPFSSCHLPLWLDGVHEASIIRHSEHTGPPFEICSQKQVALLLDSIDPPLMPEEVSDSIFSSGNCYRILDVETVLILDGFWTMSTFKCAINGAFFITIVSNSWLLCLEMDIKFEQNIELLLYITYLFKALFFLFLNMCMCCE